MKQHIAAVCRYFTAEEACRLALKAYLAAGKRIEPPPGEPWLSDGQTWSSPVDFGDAFQGELQARLSLLTLERLGTFESWTDWNLSKLASEIDPELMAPIIAAQEAELARIKSEFPDLFPAEKVNGLHPAENPPDNADSTGVENA